MNKTKNKLATRIERQTREPSFERAQKIAKCESMFRNKEVSYIAGSTCLYANVVGSSPDNLPYTTCLQIDEETGELAEFRPKPCKLKFYFDKREQKVTIAASANYGDISIALIGTPPVESNEKPGLSLTEQDLLELLQP